MTTFGLIPGACHGPWCWQRLVPVLEAKGHPAVTVDLPCDDPGAGFDRYVDVTMEALDESGDDIVLVAHSLGAHTAVRTARVRPVRGIVFVCGIIPPCPGERSDDEPALDVPGTFDGLTKDGDGRFWFPYQKDAIQAFYHDCDAETAAWAASKLRKQSTTPHAELGKAVGPPSCPSVSIVCAEDRVATADWGRWAARERLGNAPVIELDGGHSPFLSRPSELADAIELAAGTF